MKMTRVPKAHFHTYMLLAHHFEFMLIINMLIFFSDFEDRKQ